MITQIEIGGYRLLDGFEADLNPLTVVIGANAVGKSTLIDCLQLIGECCEYPLNTAISWHHGPRSLLTAGNGNGQLAWSVTFRKPPVWDGFPLAEGEALVYEVVLQADAQGQMHPQYEVLRSQEPVHGEPLKFLEATPYQQHIFDIKQRRLIPFDEAQSSSDVVRDADSVAAPREVDRQAHNKRLHCSYHKSDSSTSFPFLLGSALSWRIWHSIRDLTLLTPLRSVPRPPISNRIQHYGRTATTWGLCCTKY